MIRLLREMAANGRLALTALGGNRLRSLLTLLSIGIGVSTLIAIFSVIQGLDRGFEEQLSHLGLSSLVVSRWPLVPTYGSWWKYIRWPKVSSTDVRALRSQTTLAQGIAPVVDTQEMVTFADNSLPLLQVVGTTSDYALLTASEPEVGRFLSDVDVQVGARVAVVGAEVASRLFGSPEVAIGHSIRVGRNNYRIVGSLVRKGKALGENPDLVVLVPYSAFVDDFGAQRSMNIFVGTDDRTRLSALEQEVISILRRARRLRPDQEDNFFVSRQEQIGQLYDELTGGLYTVALGVGLITLLVGGVGIMNIMLVSVRERSREIGVRRALGARKRAILTQFLLESITVSLMGGGVGTAVGLAVAAVIDQVTPLAASVTPLGLLLGLGFSTAVGLVFGVWPAWSAASLDPAEALRYE